MEFLQPSPMVLAVMVLTVFVAYGVFGFTGFGAILVALPIMSHLLSLRVAVPVLLISDLFAAALLGWRSRSHVSWVEFARLLPFAAAGMVIGVLLLVHGSEAVLLTALGLFVVAMALWNLSGRASKRPIAASWVIPAGLVGGTFSSLFGTGGPVYTLFLARRLPDTNQLRATVGAVILVSALVRLGLFTSQGLLQPAGLLQLAFTLLPSSVAGYFVGSRIQAQAPADQVRRAIWMMLVCSGASVLWRGMNQLGN